MKYEDGDVVKVFDGMAESLGVKVITIKRFLPHANAYSIYEIENVLVPAISIIGRNRELPDKENYRIKTTGLLTEFSTGAVRDSAVGKARMELLPMDLLKRVAVWYGLGAEKYGDNNWRKGQAKSHVMGSLMRHLTAYQMGKTDEDHLSAVIWNALCLMNTDEYLSDNKEINNTEWFTDGIPNGKGAK